MKKHYAHVDNGRFSHFGLGKAGGIFCVTFPVFIFLLKFVCCTIFKIQPNYHWFPIVLSIIYFVFAGYFFLESIDYNERHFLDNQIIKIPSGNKFQYWYFIDPIGKTQKEIGKELFKRFKAKGYMIIRLILFAIIIGFGALLLVKSYNSNKIMINAIVTSPILLLFMLCNFFPKSASYLTTIYPDYSFIDAIHWEDCICPNCGALVDPHNTTVSNNNTTNWQTKNIGKTTDKYSAGNVTVYVETTHVTNLNHTNRSWKENHYCPKCKKTFSKKNGYTYTE